MDYGIAIVIAVLFYLLYFQNKQREQINELRRVMDIQFGGLRSHLSEVMEQLSWTEPQLKLNSLDAMYIAARNANLDSMEEIRQAVDAGKYQSALLPVTEYMPQRVNPPVSPE
jgi:hypothetical protein